MVSQLGSHTASRTTYIMTGKEKNVSWMEKINQVSKNLSLQHTLLRGVG